MNVIEGGKYERYVCMNKLRLFIIVLMCAVSFQLIAADRANCPKQAVTQLKAVSEGISSRLAQEIQQMHRKAKSFSSKPMSNLPIPSVPRNQRP